MEKLFPSAGCFTTAKQVQGRTLIGLHALRTSVSLLICFLLALDLLQNEEMLSLCVTLSWSASNFSSSATYSHIVSIMFGVILERIVITP